MSDITNYARVGQIVDGACVKLDTLMALIQESPREEIEEWALCCMWACSAIGELCEMDRETILKTFGQSMELWELLKAEDKGGSSDT